MFQPNLGRWMQADPTGFDGGDQNLFRALHNCPDSVVDPEGLENLRVRPGDITWKLYEPKGDPAGSVLPADAQTWCVIVAADIGCTTEPHKYPKTGKTGTKATSNAKWVFELETGSKTWYRRVPKGEQDVRTTWLLNHERGHAYIADAIAKEATARFGHQTVYGFGENDTRNSLETTIKMITQALNDINKQLSTDYDTEVNSGKLNDPKYNKKQNDEYRNRQLQWNKTPEKLAIERLYKNPTWLALFKKYIFTL